MIPPVFDESDLPERLRRLLAMEIDRVVEDLEVRREFLLETWSRHRDRGPFLDAVFTRWRTLSMTDLALVESEAVVACEAFYRELDELKLYFQFTQDMPTTMDERYRDALVRISAYGALAVQLLGGAPERPLVEFAEDAETVSLLAPPPAEPPATEDGG
jgi:hypothetical protein